MKKIKNKASTCRSRLAMDALPGVGFALFVFKHTTKLALHGGNLWRI